MSRLDALRGPAAPVMHNARSIAALAVNPGCDRRAVLDAAGVDMKKVAEHLRCRTPFGQSPFAISRTEQFKKIVKEHGGAHVLRLLREKVGLAIEQAAYDDIADVGGDERMNVRHLHTRNVLERAARNMDGAGTLFDHPLLKLDVAGYEVYLEPDVIAFRAEGRFHVVQIKSFAILDDQADTGKVSAAAREAAVYVHAMRELFGQLGMDPLLVSHEVMLVCPKDFANFPTAAMLDVRQQLDVLRRQLSRLTRVDRILDLLPPGLSLDLGLDGKIATRPVAELREAVAAIDARYAPECLSSCEMAYFCRSEAREQDSVDALGRAVRDDLGGLDSVRAVLGLAEGAQPVSPEQEDVAAQLRQVRAVHAEAVA